jgi:hypothetical protein
VELHTICLLVISFIAMIIVIQYGNIVSAMATFIINVMTAKNGNTKIGTKLMGLRTVHG